MNSLSIVVILGLTSILAQNMGLREFTQRPEVPFEATTFEQDALIEAAAMHGDSREKASTAACDTLIADETLPFELRCWAVRQKMRLCAYAKREWEALETGKDWLLEHGEADYNPLAIRYQMGRMVVYRGHGGFVPLYKDAKAIFEDLFEHHPADNLLVVQAHLDYSNFLGTQVVTNPELHHEAVAHVGMAADALERILENSQGMTAQQRHKYEEWLASLKEGYERGLQTPVPNHAEMSEEAYVDMRLQWAEDTERIRQQRIDSGLLDPNNPPPIQSFSSQDIMELNRREQQQSEENSHNVPDEQPDKPSNDDSPMAMSDASIPNQTDTPLAGSSVEPNNSDAHIASIIKSIMSIIGALICIGVLIAYIKYYKK